MSTFIPSLSYPHHYLHHRTKPNSKVSQFSLDYSEDETSDEFSATLTKQQNKKTTDTSKSKVVQTAKPKKKSNFELKATSKPQRLSLEDSDDDVDYSTKLGTNIRATNSPKTSKVKVQIDDMTDEIDEFDDFGSKPTNNLKPKLRGGSTSKKVSQKKSKFSLDDDDDDEEQSNSVFSDDEVDVFADTTTSSAPSLAPRKPALVPKIAQTVKPINHSLVPNSMITPAMPRSILQPTTVSRTHSIPASNLTQPSVFPTFGQIIEQCIALKIPCMAYKQLLDRVENFQTTLVTQESQLLQLEQAKKAMLAQSAQQLKALSWEQKEKRDQDRKMIDNHYKLVVKQLGATKVSLDNARNKLSEKTLDLIAKIEEKSSNLHAKTAKR